jgi:hypothetical protein
MTGTELYDWSRLVAKVKLTAPLMQRIADRRERLALFRFQLKRTVAFLNRFKDDTGVPE